MDGEQYFDRLGDGGGKRHCQLQRQPNLVRHGQRNSEYLAVCLAHRVYECNADAFELVFAGADCNAVAVGVGNRVRDAFGKRQLQRHLVELGQRLGK